MYYKNTFVCCKHDIQVFNVRGCVKKKGYSYIQPTFANLRNIVSTNLKLESENGG